MASLPCLGTSRFYENGQYNLPHIILAGKQVMGGSHWHCKRSGFCLEEVHGIVRASAGYCSSSPDEGVTPSGQQQRTGSVKRHYERAIWGKRFSKVIWLCIWRRKWKRVSVTWGDDAATWPQVPETTAASDQVHYFKHSIKRDFF